MNLHFTGKDSSLATNEIQVFRTYHFASICKKIPIKSVTKRLELLRIFERESTKENLDKVKLENDKTKKNTEKDLEITKIFTIPFLNRHSFIFNSELS